LDIDIPLIKQIFKHIEGVCNVEVIDNRSGDAFFATVLVELKEPATAVKEIKKAVHSFAKVKLFLVDSHGNELALNSTNVDDALKYVKYNEEKFSH
jgi:hypothetical protein